MFQIVKVLSTGYCELSWCLPLDVSNGQKCFSLDFTNCQGAYHWMLHVVRVLTTGCCTLSGCLPLDVVNCHGRCIPLDFLKLSRYSIYLWMLRIVRVLSARCCELSGCCPLDVANCQGAFRCMLQIVLSFFFKLFIYILFSFTDLVSVFCYKSRQFYSTLYKKFYFFAAAVFLHILQAQLVRPSAVSPSSESAPIASAMSAALLGAVAPVAGAQIVRMLRAACCELSECLQLDVANCQNAYSWMLLTVRMLTAGCC